MPTKDAGHGWWVASYAAPDAVTFLDLISPVTGVFSGSGGLPRLTLFRGVDDEKHALLPSAFRPDTTTLLEIPHLPRGPSTNTATQIRRELQTVAAFINAADRQGHRIPEDAQELRAEIKRIDKALCERRTLAEWPPRSLLSVIALAQHYGLPTRMLDWTLDPYVAAYFAAEACVRNATEACPASWEGTCIRKYDTEGSLAFWGLSSTTFMVNEIGLDEARIAKLSLQYVSAPGADNANATAQKAVFLVYRQFKIDLQAEFEFKPYDYILAEDLKLGLGSAPVYQITLPKTEARQLLFLLARQGYDGSVIYPGLDGAAKSVKERFLWPDEIGPDPRSERSRAIFDQMIAQYKDRKNNLRA